MPVSVKGAIELRKALRTFAPDLAKGLNQEMATALKPIVNKARGFLPSDSEMLSGWSGNATRADGKFPQYNQATARRGITYKISPSKRNRRGFRSLATILNKSAAGAIYETAGRRNPNGRPQGKYQTVTINSSNPAIGTYSYQTTTGKTFGRSNNPNAGKQFIDAINATGKIVDAYTREPGQRGRASRKMRGRAIYRAYAEDQGKATAAVMRAIEKAAATFKERSAVK